MNNATILEGLHNSEYRLTGFFIKLNYLQVFKSLNFIHNPLLQEQSVIETFRAMLQMKTVFTSLHLIQDYLHTYSDTIALNLIDIAGGHTQTFTGSIEYVPCPMLRSNPQIIDEVMQCLTIIPVIDTIQAFNCFTRDIPSENDLIKNHENLMNTLSTLSPLLSLSFQLFYFKNYSIAQIQNEIDITPYELLQTRIQTLQYLKSVYPAVNIPLLLIMFELVKKDTSFLSIKG